MANLCEKLINSCIAADCNNPLFQGVDSEALIANFSDIESVTYDATNPSIITGITMKTDTVEEQEVSRCFYTVQQLGNTPYSGSNTSMTTGTYGNKFTNVISLAVVDNGPEITENIIDNLANGKFVVILKNDYVHTDGKNQYSVYGIKKGLKATAISRELYNEDTQSAWTVELTEENAPKAGLFFYVSTGTEAAVEALKCDCE